MPIKDILLEKIIETSNNNITITDEMGVILYTNKNHWSVYVNEPKPFIGQSIFELEEQGILSPSITAIVLKEKRPVQVMQNTKTGKRIMSTAYPIFNENGEITRVISYAIDQTEISILQAKYEQLEEKGKDYATKVEEQREQKTTLYRSKEMRQIMKTIQRVANTDATVLILGETGVGKSMYARHLHTLSHRRTDPFIEVNCSTIPSSLFESEMFGYEPGSFTGAQKKGKQGLVEKAHKGTLFLDEIGELPLSVQAKLLKVLQEKKFMRVGGNKELNVDFRLVTATNKNLEELVQKGEFRPDLYYRLNVIPLFIPPLRIRKEDVSILIHHFTELINRKYQTKKILHPATFELLLTYHWPGNVRELENFIERLVLTTEETVILPNFLPSYMMHQAATNREVLPVAEQIIIENHSLKTVIEQVEKWMIFKAQKQCKSTYEMAKYLGISQPSVIRKLKKYNTQAAPIQDNE